MFHRYRPFSGGSAKDIISKYMETKESEVRKVKDMERFIREYDSNKKTADVTIEVVRLLSGMSRSEVSVVLATAHMLSDEYSVFPVLPAEDFQHL